MTEEKSKFRRDVRIAFVHMPGDGWSAGLYYLKNLFSAIRLASYHDLQPEIVLLVRKKENPESYKELMPLIDEILENDSKVDFTNGLSGIIKKIGRKIGVLSTEHPLSIFLKLNKIDVIFMVDAPPEDFLVPVLTWIPDFQHRHFPQFFTEKERRRRDKSFADSSMRSSRVILSSKDALDDFVEFAPATVQKGRVLSFVAQIPEEVFKVESDLVCYKYFIPNKFILLPNQFWMHKNHHTVIRALQRALKEEPELTIVCTGNTNENRDATFVSKLLCSISTSGIRERMIILGLVPREDLFFLMRQSIAVLQPSLFEGWNTSLEEVKSLGKTIIVSDIPVHREQNAPGAIYFKPTDEQSLAKIIVEVYKNSNPGSNEELERVAEENRHTRTIEYGNTFMSIVKEVFYS